MHDCAAERRGVRWPRKTSKMTMPIVDSCPGHAVLEEDAVIHGVLISSGSSVTTLIGIGGGQEAAVQHARRACGSDWTATT
jgi:hypothetical protein